MCYAVPNCLLQVVHYHWNLWCWVENIWNSCSYSNNICLLIFIMFLDGVTIVCVFYFNRVKGCFWSKFVKMGELQFKKYFPINFIESFCMIKILFVWKKNCQPVIYPPLALFLWSIDYEKSSPMDQILHVRNLKLNFHFWHRCTSNVWYSDSVMHVIGLLHWIQIHLYIFCALGKYSC